ncbi:CAP domain-containing protein [Neobacillus dielmonensis]|uniref:CAP domain-containing protein n=1 Tax=Neobacillus dielmonensis TaxID=1347369 RepID=UPI0005A800EC|nr:CAP domain-containing protein [Neobacillus dielmonensis]
MKKKAILTVAAAAAVILANPVIAPAHAATLNTQTVQQKVYTYKVSNSEEINKILADFYAKWGVKAPTQTVTQPSQPTAAPTTQTQQPTQTAQQPQQTTAAPATQKTATEPQPAAAETTTALSAYEQKVVDLTNQERAKNGLPALKVDLTLSKMAHEKSRDMSANNYFSHTSPTYGSPFDMMKKYGISYRYAGENIAMGQRTPEEVVTAWMNSEGHRANILNSNYNYIGVGYVSQGNYWTQEFIGR